MNDTLKITTPSDREIVVTRAFDAAWYPIALAVTALPCAWLGGALYRRRDRAGR